MKLLYYVILRSSKKDLHCIIQKQIQFSEKYIRDTIKTSSGIKSSGISINIQEVKSQESLRICIAIITWHSVQHRMQ